MAMIVRLATAATLGAAILGAAALAAGCARKPAARMEKGTLPDLPNAATTVEAGTGVGFHGVRVAVKEIGGSGLVRYGVAAPGSIEDTHEVDRGRWALHGDVLLRFEAMRGEGTPRTLLNLYHLPSLAASGQPADLGAEIRLEEGNHVFAGGRFIALGAVQGNDPGKTDDERAEVTVLLDGAIHELSVPELGAVAAGSSYVRAGNAYDGDTPGDGVAFLRIVPADELWKGATSVEQARLESGESLEEAGFELRTDTLEGRDESWRALLSLRTPATRRDVIAVPGESIRAGAVEVLLREADAAGISVDIARHPEAVVAEAAHYPGAVPVEPGKASDLQREPTKATRRMIVGQSTEFWDARFELVGLVANDPTDLMDDAAEFLVHHDGTSERLFAKKGHRHTVRGENRWWVVDVRSVTAGRGGDCEITLEAGSFLGNPDRQTLPF